MNLRELSRINIMNDYYFDSNITKLKCAGYATSTARTIMCAQIAHRHNNDTFKVN